MLIVMKKDADSDQIAAVVCAIGQLGFRAHVMPGPTRTGIAITGNAAPMDSSHFRNMPGVYEAICVTKPYKLITRELHPDNSTVSVDGAKIGGDQLTIMAGPYTIDNCKQAFDVAEAVRESGAKFFSIGLWRTPIAPCNGQGSIQNALRIVAEIRSRFGLKCVVEAVDHATFDIAEDCADIIQIEARNMQNFPLLRRAGSSHLPVILKRGVAATIDEWLLAAEYIMVEGNHKVVLCEGGIRTFNQHNIDTLDLASIPYIRRVSHLPIVVDPSRGAGQNHLVMPLGCAAIAAGADGLVVEVSDNHKNRLPNALDLTQYHQMVTRVRAIYDVVQRCPQETVAAAATSG